jgi:hypothetical protein
MRYETRLTKEISRELSRIIFGAASQKHRPKSRKRGQALPMTLPMFGEKRGYLQPGPPRSSKAR